MEERLGQFYISVGRLCEDAAVAGLPVLLRVDGGRELEGIPEPPMPAGERGLDDTGYEDGLSIGAQRVPLHDVTEIILRRPDTTGHAAPD